MSNVWEHQGGVGLVMATGATMAEAFVALVAYLQDHDLEEDLIDLRVDIDSQVLLTASFDRGATPVEVAP